MTKPATPLPPGGIPFDRSAAVEAPRTAKLSNFETFVAVGGRGGDPDALPKTSDAPPKQKPAWIEWGGGHPAPALNKFIWEKSGKAPLTSAKLEALRKADAEGDRLRASLEQFYVDKVPAYVRQKRAEHEAAAIAGKHSELPPSEESTYDSFQRARAAIHEQIRKVCAEVHPILVELAKDLVSVCDTLGDAVMFEETEQHRKYDAKFDWPYVPSRFLIQLRQAEWRIPKLVPPPASGFDISAIAAALGVEI